MHPTTPIPPDPRRPVEYQALTPLGRRAHNMLAAVVHFLADDRDAVAITAYAGPAGIDSGASSIDFIVRCAGSDVGKLLGHGGRTARGLRTLLHSHSKTGGERFTLDIVGSNAAATAAPPPSPRP